MKKRLPYRSKWLSNCSGVGSFSSTSPPLPMSINVGVARTV